MQHLAETVVMSGQTETALDDILKASEKKA
jgi:hypothetical protein